MKHTPMYCVCDVCSTYVYYIVTPPPLDLQMASASEIQNILQYLDPQLHLPMMEFAKKAGFEVTPVTAPQTPSKADVATATTAEITKAGTAISTHFTCEGGVYAFIKPTEETAALSKAHTAAIANLAKLAYVDGNFVNACAF
eukprot:GFYU01067467.1.p1 GENE.GFYU01067467.1~~GFYU01067467.1.p1  ORF type:complete len:142 (+),score=27.61 GFYU01067467.1:3-428(+)